VSVHQLRLCVTAVDYDEALRFYRDVLGLPVEGAFTSDDGGRVTILGAGRATLELADPTYAAHIDAVEVGRRVAGHVRVALEVADVPGTTAQLAGAGATVIAEPTRTPWDSLNARLEGPAGLQLTLFQELALTSRGSPIGMPMTGGEVRLEPIDEGNVKAVFDLRVAPGQEAFVAPNAWSLAQAVAEAPIAWPRAVVTGDEVVGFLMLEIDPHEEDGRPFWLWRLMIGQAYQRRGHGSAALDIAVQEVRARGGTEIWTSWVDAPGGPGPFYLAHGFVPNGELDDDEVVAVLAL
jgi:lactoylglutathione lyase